MCCLLGASTWGAHTWSRGSWVCGRLHDCGPLVPEHAYGAAPLRISPRAQGVRAKPSPSSSPHHPPHLSSPDHTGPGFWRGLLPGMCEEGPLQRPLLPRLSLPTHLPPPPSRAPASSLGTPSPTAEGELSLLPSSQSGSFRVWLHWRPGVHPYLPRSSGYRSRGQTGVVWWHRLAWPGGGQ